MLVSVQIKAARAMIGWSAKKLAEESGLSLPTIQRMETKGTGRSSVENLNSVETALSAYIEFIPENGGGAGVRLRKESD